MSIDKKTLTRIHSAIRESFKQSEKYQQTLDAALSANKGPKGGKRYVCSMCVQEFPQSDLEVNHEPPVCEIGRLWHTYSPDEYYDRVFGLPVEVVCKPCHKKLTKQQNQKRREAKNGKVENC